MQICCIGDNQIGLNKDNKPSTVFDDEKYDVTSRQSVTSQNPDGRNGVKKSKHTQNVKIEQSLDEIHGFVKTYYEQQRNNNSTSLRKSDWMLVALVIDRLLLLLFCICTFVISVVLLTGNSVDYTVDVDKI